MDEELRSLARVCDYTDPMAVRRVVTDRLRREERDPVAELEALIGRARAIYADRHFRVEDVAAQVGYARSVAAKNAAKGDPAPGFLWVSSPGKGRERLYKFAAPEHEAKFRDGAGLMPAMCEVCGAEGMVGGRCVLPAGEDEGLERSAFAVTWWRGTRSGERRQDSMRHFALVVCDEDAGFVCVAVGTGTATQRVSSVFPILKKQRVQAYRPIDRAKLRRWALEPDRGRVLMTTERAGAFVSNRAWVKPIEPKATRGGGR
jgi:hypothetical protein